MVSTFKRRNLPHLLLRARETLMARFRPILREHGITEQQWRVLRTLNDTGDMEPNQLADACLILSPSLTRMLAAMEQADMIVRTRSSVDQRRQVISLTPRAAGSWPTSNRRWTRHTQTSRASSAARGWRRSTASSTRPSS